MTQMIKTLRKTAVLSLLATACLSTFSSQSTTAEDQALLEYLNSQPGMTATISDSQYYPDEYTAVEIEYLQPTDHGQPGAEQFTQHMNLLHKGSTIAMSLETMGYTGQFRPWIKELAQEKGLNQLAVEHRYFGPSTPESKDMNHLNIEQAADDMHRIVEAIRPFYEGKWVSTGTSKGGMTAIFHRYFYPDDVDATLANVAPISFGRNDTRYIDFLENAETETCRATLKEFQRTALLRKDEVTAYIKSVPWMTMTHETMGYDIAYDRAVAEHPFTFHQTGRFTCDSVPGPNGSAEALTWEILGDLYTFSDAGLKTYGSYFYQAYTQLGHPKLPTAHFSDLLTSDPNDYRTYSALPPENDHFDNIMRRINAWTIAQADKLMLVYGDSDPWTAGQLTPRIAKHADNYKFTRVGGHHESDIFNLPAEDRTIAEAALDEWLDLPETTNSLKHILRPVETPKSAYAAMANQSGGVLSDEVIVAKMKEAMGHPETLRVGAEIN
jgi:hypothetical protein